jgi:hypothetical protein
MSTWYHVLAHLYDGSVRTSCICDIYDTSADAAIAAVLTFPYVVAAEIR